MLTLPHPRIFERDFVLKPLLELRPNHVLADDVRVAQAAKPESERYGKAERISRYAGERGGLRMVGWVPGCWFWERACGARGRVVGLGDGLRFAKLERWLIAAFRGLAMALRRAAT